MSVTLVLLKPLHGSISPGFLEYIVFTFKSVFEDYPCKFCVQLQKPFASLFFQEYFYGFHYKTNLLFVKVTVRSLISRCVLRCFSHV